MMKDQSTFAKCLAVHMAGAGPKLATSPRLRRGILSGIVLSVAIFAASAIGGMAVALWLLQGAPR